ncbi:MAG: arcA [Sphingobacteriales bacterium]|nr:arcA [Sphingobacteriales bacterium]
MILKNENFELNITSEIGTLRSVLIHSPDKGLGRVVPSKAQDWLFEDIVHLKTVRKKEYDYYVKLLMYFLDPEMIKGHLISIDSDEKNREFYKPHHSGFHSSLKVIELEVLLADILEVESIKTKLVASVCAIEGCSYQFQQQLIETSPIELAKIFISGSLKEGPMMFSPIPNLIFTRDLGIIINNHILLNKPAKKARNRETLLTKYIFYNHPIFKNYVNNILEIPNSVQQFLRPGEDNTDKTTLEGGDVMMVSKNHLLMGCSERTSPNGVNEAIKLLFDMNVVSKVSVIKIPPRRDFMHIDTIFTQVKRNIWVLLGSISNPTKPNKSEPLYHLTDTNSKDKPEILQFIKDQKKPNKFDSIEDLLNDVSRNDLNSEEETEFIYSGNNVFPYDAREQWTDSCNLLALKEGVVLGYDRNDKTVEGFVEAGFNIINASELVNRLENDELNVNDIENTLILMPSAELSRARGGFHCMSMPLFRSEIENL